MKRSQPVTYLDQEQVLLDPRPIWRSPSKTHQLRLHERWPYVRERMGAIIDEYFSEPNNHSRLKHQTLSPKQLDKLTDLAFPAFRVEVCTVQFLLPFWQYVFEGERLVQQLIKIERDVELIAHPHIRNYLLDAINQFLPKLEHLRNLPPLLPKRSMIRWAKRRIGSSKGDRRPQVTAFRQEATTKLNQWDFTKSEASMIIARIENGLSISNISFEANSYCKKNIRAGAILKSLKK